MAFLKLYQFKMCMTWSWDFIHVGVRFTHEPAHFGLISDFPQFRVGWVALTLLCADLLPLFIICSRSRITKIFRLHFSIFSLLCPAPLFTVLVRKAEEIHFWHWKDKKNKDLETTCSEVRNESDILKWELWDAQGNDKSVDKQSAVLINNCF